jgi:putative nucleotidyltransferase with HDIG domain
LEDRPNFQPSTIGIQFLLPCSSCYPYQHSLQTANLAEQAAKIVRADPLLVRVGALYHDVGKAINPQTIQGQIEGAIVQAAGYTILENFIQENSQVKTSQFSTYLIPTSLDIPDNIESRILEFPDPNGPWGARGMGEMPYMPFAPAVIAAVHDATGVWFDEFPLTPERILRGLGKLEDQN